MRVREAYQYCADYLADASDGKSDRTFRRIVNAALSDLSASHPWTRYQAAAQIPLDVGVDGTAVSVDQDDNLLTFGSTSPVLQKYLTEKWELTIGTSAKLVFRLGAIDSPTSARFADGQRWIDSDATASAHVWKRSVYPLPTGCKAIREILLGSSRVGLIPVAPTVLDALRWDNPTETGQPLQYAIREHEIEVWPPLGPTTTREVLLIAYLRQPTALTESTPEDDQVDFDPRWDDLLEAALDVVIASKHSKQTTLELMPARARMRERLAKAMAEDATRTNPEILFGLRVVPELGAAEALRFRRLPQGDDA